jgi:hypothetical protein
MKDKCPCGSGCAINFTLVGGMPAVSGYDGPARVVTSKRHASGAPIVLAQCGSCERDPMFRDSPEGAAFKWVAIGEMYTDEKEFFDLDFGAS